MTDELMKIPDSVLLEKSRHEVVMLQDQLTTFRRMLKRDVDIIHNLNKEIERLKNTVPKEEIIAIKKEWMYQNIRKQNKELKKTIKRLRLDKNDLISKLVKFEKNV